MSDPTNHKRAMWALSAVKHFGRETRMDKAGEEVETMMQDLLCDMMHLCDVEGIDFETLLQSAQGCYEEELEEDD